MASSLNLFRKDKTGSWVEIDTTKSEQMKTMQLKEMLVKRGISIYSRMISKCKFDVYIGKKGDIKKVLNKTDYILNVRPNPNDSASSFWNRVVSKLLTDGEALIVLFNESMYLADSFNTTNTVMIEKVYSDIEITDTAGDSIKLNKSLTKKDVIYISLGDWAPAQFINGFYSEFDDVIASSLSSFVRANSKKVILKTPAQIPLMKDQNGVEINAKTYIDKIVGDYLSLKDSVTRLTVGFEIEDMSDKPSTSQESAHTKEIREFGNHIAGCLGIPNNLFWGSLTEKTQAIDDFITTSVSYIMETISDAVNVSMLSQTEYLGGSRIRYNKNSLKSLSILDLAKNIDKLFSIGYSFNMIQEMLDKPRINETWADEHHITKNYMRTADMGKGGD